MRWFIPNTPMVVQTVSTEGGGFCLATRTFPFPKDKKHPLDGISIRLPGVKKRRARPGGPNVKERDP
jgi:hypothetical protein